MFAKECVKAKAEFLSNQAHGSMNVRVRDRHDLSTGFGHRDDHSKLPAASSCPAMRPDDLDSQNVDFGDVMIFCLLLLFSWRFDLTITSALTLATFASNSFARLRF